MGVPPRHAVRVASSSIMCGRYVSLSSPDRLALQFGIDEVLSESLGERYNVAPTDEVYAVVAHRGRRRLGTLRWGLVPPWASEPGAGPAPINARLETITDKRLFAPAFASRRCLIPADGFYEWQAGATGKRPFYIHDPAGQPLAFAGIWSRWSASDGTRTVASCAIVTTAAAGPMSPLHDRMPVVLPRSVWDAWLVAPPEDATPLRDTVAALPPPALAIREVSPRVNSVRNDGPSLLAAPSGEPPTLFG